jgi:hypothetical protein
MAIEHADLTDPELHEPKGASAAVADSFYVADGAGSGAWKKRLVKFAPTLTPAVVNANNTSEQTFTVTGVVLSTDQCFGISKPTHQAGLGIVGWRVVADNQVAITFMNCTGGNITPTAAQVYQVFIYRT